MKLEEIVHWVKYQVVVGLVAGSVILGCDYQTEPEQCCQCLDDNNCTVYTEERCVDVFQILYGQDSILVDTDCVRENDCYLLCAEAGAYFDKDKMVFKK